MILKPKDILNNFNKDKKFYLLYGINTGLMEEFINDFIKKKLSKNIFKYDENEVILNINNFKESILNKSFFDDDKLIIINRASDKILEIIEDLILKEINDTTIIIKANILEKKSKLRIFFEINKNTLCIPFYEDDNKSLHLMAQKIFLENKIKISAQYINFLVEKSKNNRINLKNELEKLIIFSNRSKSVEFNDLVKLTSSADYNDISELSDKLLLNNKKKTLKIINENISISDDNITIIRSILFKLKRLKIIKKEILKKKNEEQVISSFRPLIFWKDKITIKEQLKVFNLNEINIFIKKLNKLELLVKQNVNLSNILTNNFIIERINQSNNSI